MRTTSVTSRLSVPGRFSFLCARMSLTLTPSDIARCEAATRTLLSPLTAASVDDWRYEVNRTLRDLFHADQTLFAISSAETVYLSEDMAPATLAGFNRYLDAVDADGVPRLRDPILNTWLVQRRATGQEIYNEQLIEAALHPFGYSLYRSMLYHDVIRGGGLHDAMGTYTSFSQGEATLTLAYHRAGANPFGASSTLLLRALVPAFKAGLDTLARLHAHRTALDGLSEALFVTDHAGRELHRNRALTALLDPDAERERVLGELRFMALRLCQLGFPHAAVQGQTPFAPAQREVQTRQGAYRLRGTLLAPGFFNGTGAVMISVERVAAAPALPPPEVLRSRFGLTKREAEAALLLAEGLSNEALAERLFVSPHTARHHTENVLAKLALNSRKGLALKLMQAC